jgi:hypothetical protein
MLASAPEVLFLFCLCGFFPREFDKWLSNSVKEST